MLLVAKLILFSHIAKTSLTRAPVTHIIKSNSLSLSCNQSSFSLYLLLSYIMSQALRIDLASSIVIESYVFLSIKS